MSLFDKDIVNHPVYIPKEEAIKYTLDWILKRAKSFLESKAHELNSSRRDFYNLYCQEYLRVRCNDFLRGLARGDFLRGLARGINISDEIPTECNGYPDISSYNVNVDYIEDVSEQTYTFIVKCIYRYVNDNTYRKYIAQFDL